jgi:OpgC protein
LLSANAFQPDAIKAPTGAAYRDLRNSLARIVPMEPHHAHQIEETIERDVRLDLFRGLGLWMIFLDHIPNDGAIGWITLRNYGFSDAAEFFVFISGYLAGFIYGPIIASGFLLSAAKRLCAYHVVPDLYGPGRENLPTARQSDV